MAKLIYAAIVESCAPQTVRSASVGDMFAARTAGISPAIAPIAIAAASPPPQASGGMTTAQPLVDA